MQGLLIAGGNTHLDPGNFAAFALLAGTFVIDVGIDALLPPLSSGCQDGV